MRTKLTAMLCAATVAALTAFAAICRPSVQSAPPASKSTTAPPVSVFAELDGAWAGTFVGYDSKGHELYRITVRQTYETINDTTQTVRIEDRMPDGTIIRGEGVNTARRLDDGTLALSCSVNKSNGEHVEHSGRLVNGPDGDHQIIWYSDAPGRTETFRELVRKESGETIYEINGMGRYDQTMILMNGRYRRIRPDTVNDDL